MAGRSSGFAATARELQQLLLQRGCRQTQRRWLSRPNSSRGKVALPLAREMARSEWWVVDGELHEIGPNIPPRERFLIPRDNIPNRRRKLLRAQFMRRTRLVLKDFEHDSWCKQYMELYQELRDDWERLYWDEGHAKKIAEDHANYESAEDDDADFSLHSRRRNSDTDHSRDIGFVRNNQDHEWQRVSQVRDKFEFDRERRMRQKAFAPMNMVHHMDSEMRDRTPAHFDGRRFFPRSSGESLAFSSAGTNPSSEPFDVKRFFPRKSEE